MYFAANALASCVSIHAPARGATRNIPLFSRETRFQSTRPRGARHDDIRACVAITSFNPRAREGRDEVHTGKIIVEDVFQSTRPRGARQIAKREIAGLREFQSTRPRGARPQAMAILRTTRRVSIHAPARGATGDSFAASPAFNRFNPRAREGRDGAQFRVIAPRNVSIHAPARGATP